MSNRKNKPHLGITHPEIAKTFHPIKNEISLERITKGSNRKLWWLGDCGHEWIATPFERVRGLGDCRVCRKLNVPFERSLASLCPQAAKEWHPTLNGTRLPTNVYGNSSSKFFFQCEVCDHVWEATAHSRTRGTGCPACARKERACQNRVRDLKVYPNHIGVTHPQWIPFFDELNNAPLKIEHVTSTSPRKVYWKCPYCEKSSLISTNQLLRWKPQQRCLHCKKNWLSSSDDENAHLIRANHIGITHPQWVSFFDKEKNFPLKVEHISQHSTRKIYWKCPSCQKSSIKEPRQLLHLKIHQHCSHCKSVWSSSSEDENTHLVRSNHIGITHPQWVSFFDKEKNFPLKVEYISQHSTRKIYWKCPSCQKSSIKEPRQLLCFKIHQHCSHCGKAWLSSNEDKNIHLVRSNHIGMTHPQWVSFFDKEKNLPLKVEYISQHSTRKIYWKCPYCQKSSIKEPRQLLHFKIHQYCSHCGEDWVEMVSNNNC